MGAKAPPLPKCTTAEELRSNILAFRKGWEVFPERMRERNLFGLSTYWLYDPSTSGFANAKFVGYKGMTLKKYEQALHEVESDDRQDFDGRITKKTISKALSKKWEKSSELSDLLLEFINQVDGFDVMERVKKSKKRERWQFISLDLAEDSVYAPTQKRRRQADSGQDFLDDSDYQTEITGLEGGKRLVTHVRTERDRDLVDDVKNKWRQGNPDLECVVCGFSFLRTYGNELGDGFVEAHHRELLSGRKVERETTFADFDRVCSNCHRMLHKMENMCSDKLRRIVEENRK